MAISTPDDSSRSLAERTGAHAAIVNVSSREALSASMVQIALTHPDIATLVGAPGNDVMVRVSDGDHHVRRRYSVRSLDDDQATAKLWISTTHSGPGADWARSVSPGDPVDLIGPRGKIALDEMADWHLFVGDLTALGAFYRLAESVEAPGRVIFVVELDSIDDALTPTLVEGIGPTAIFIERRNRPLGDPSALLAALASFEVPTGPGHAYLFGEFATVRTVKSALLDRGFDESAIDVKAFWRAGTSNAEHGEPPKQ